VIESQYIASYLTMTANPDTRYTPDTYLAYTLRGSARTSWSGGYARALMRAINRRVAAGTVVAVPSKGGSTAWMRAEDLTPKAVAAITSRLEGKVARQEALKARETRRGHGHWARDSYLEFTQQELAGWLADHPKTGETS
jgi:hypothetical protein